IRLAPGETLLLYTDGLIEAPNAVGEEYGLERLAAVAATANRQPRAIVDSCLRDLAAFRGAPGSTDDLTILAISRS
ncbi:MAG TPA: SpoIIE family protein phosphatase, partial [Vicinamibacterales bacterium]|nr:SpoIIE family protein phosphatase [Vicinamibacterales bacterium]